MTLAAVPVPYVAVPLPVLRALINAATLDAKTWLLHQPAWTARVARRFARSPDSQRHAVLMIDVDRFADLNTRLGHLAADTILHRIADVLRRQDDAIPGRFGGDEFVLYVPDTDRRGAQHVADQVCRSIAHLTIDVASPGAGQLRISGITVSIGGTVRTGPDLDPVAMLWTASGAMYAVKRTGGGRAHIQM